ncbi:aldo/keto reductase [Virgibacillus sp. W0181]|uniref:aldo/keto reductase n=1 Tax=Virgibacillus sp. W0181 TaxID=3391581 RepID=UPI003F449D94
MKRNQIGKSDLYISELTLGCMSLGTDRTKAGKIIDQAIDMGINHLDTADLYDFGENEKIVGDAIKNKRKEIILTTKTGNNFNRETKNWFWDPSKKHIMSSVKESLRRLKTDYIDLYLLHGGTIDDPFDDTIAAFESLKQEGIIRAYGISSIRPNVIQTYVEEANIDAVMMQYNLFDRRPEEEILDLLNDNNISVLARGPLAKGILTSKSTFERKVKSSYLDYTYEEIKHMYNQLGAYSKENSLSGLAFQYVLYHPAVTSAVFGASSSDQLIENVRVDLAEKLSPITYAKLQKITKQTNYKNHLT